MANFRLEAEESILRQMTDLEERMFTEITSLRARLAGAEAHIGHLCSLVEWWAPKDGVQRTADARAFLTPDSASGDHKCEAWMMACRVCGKEHPATASQPTAGVK